jgi:YHS domain-containing protein
MVNDRYMGTPQIPVPVGDKTYFGCCAMCKQRLETDATVRTGTDPVSGNHVDKASAVIARNASGKVFYFENEGTLRRYRP